MSFRRIVVPVMGAECDAVALSAGFLLARSQTALLDAVYMRPDPAEAVPYVGDASSAAVIEDIYQATKMAADAACAAAKNTFEAAAKKAGMTIVAGGVPDALPAARFKDQMGSATRTITRTAKLADLVVTADIVNNPSALMAFESALIGARKPVLVVPASPLASIGRSIVVAWNGSGEAAYAVASAIPLLASASAVHVLCGEPGQADAPAPEPVIAYLKLHGVAASPAVFDIKSKSSVGAALIERAAALGADLLVMGGYGHSRLREFILGGVTRHVIANAPIAVLMAH